MRMGFIVGSPKPQKSASLFLLKEIEKKLDNKFQLFWFESKKQLTGEQEKDLFDCDVLVLSFPLYVDGVPSHLLEWLQQVEKKAKKQDKKITVYAIVNCGFYEAKQNHLALRIIEKWCEKSGFGWGQGLQVGAGGMVMVAPAGKGPSKNLGKAIEKFCLNICNKKTGETLLVHPNFPRKLYITAAHFGWKKQGKKNGLTKKEIYDQP